MFLRQGKAALRALGLREPMLRFRSSGYRLEVAAAGELVRNVSNLGFERIKRKYDQRVQQSADGLKYLNLEWHAREVAHEARRVGALGAPRMRVLDLGPGTGLFLHLLSLCGHDVLALDVDNNPVFNDMIALLAISRIIHCIQAFQPLPPMREAFGRITAFSICFNRHVGGAVWGIQEWAYFFDDCLARLRPGGSLFLNFNPGKEASFRFLPDPVAVWVRRLPGAYLSRSKETLVYHADGARCGRSQKSSACCG